MKKYSLIIIFVLLFCLVPFKSLTAGSLDIVINEIAWMGTTNSANDEWIELYNNTKNPINLEGWVLKASDGTPEIKLSGTIPANGFYLLERTDDDTMPGISADLIYKGALGNNGEDLKLYDNSGNLVDEVNCVSSWFAGDNKIKQTMERKISLISGNNSSNWQTSQNPGGTAKTENSKPSPAGKEQKVEVFPLPAQLKSSEYSPLLVQQPEIKKNYPSGIIFNEILPSPEGPDDKEEYIEILNQNNFEVDLSEWKIKDTNGKITTYVLPEKTKISPEGFLVLSRPITKITLNNNGDGLNLIQPNGNIIDSVNYEKAPQNQSYNKTPSGWIWNAVLTPEKANNIPPQFPKEVKTKLPNNFSPEEKTASIGEKIQKLPRFLSVLLIALLLAILSGLAIFILKKFLTRNL